MKNSEYWKLRFVQLEEAQNKLANEGCKGIESIYRQTLTEIEGKIDTWYRRLAKNNEISMAEARKFLSGSELEEFKWDVHDYIKYGKENAVSGQWVKQLENASAKFHISKYEALKIQTQQSFESLFAKQKGITSDTIAEVYKSGYYHTAFEIQKGVGVGWDISRIDQNQVEKVLAKPWAVDGKNFSERIWSNKEKLVSEVHNELTRNIITGADPQKAIDSIAKKMNTSKYNAGRLVMTEEAYFSSAAQKDCFDDLGVEEYEVVATLDSHTSDICRSMDGKHFPMSEYKAGVTAPPFHVFCRSTACPWFDENFGEVGERAARGEDGKTYYVPADMNYKEWKKEFVEGGDKSGLKEVDKIEKGGIIKAGSDNLALENQRYGRDKSTLVNKTYIDSGEYKRKFDNATDNPKVNKTLYDCAKKALKHRSGTTYEDMYWIDSVTGDIVLSVVDSNVERSIVYTEKIKNLISKRQHLITIHTHPSSMPPSVDDFNSCFKNGYDIGFIACHNGKVFKYSSQQEISKMLYNMYIKDFLSDGYEEFEAQIKSIEKLKESHAIEFEEVVSNG